MDHDDFANKLEQARRRWPPGQALLPQAYVDNHKRERCVEALAQLTHELGANNITAALLIKQAGISRTTFYQLFEGKGEAIDYACELSSRALIEAVEAAAREPGEWPERVDRAIVALLAAAAEKPRLAELSLVHAISWGHGSGGPFDSAISDALVTVLADGRPAHPDRHLGPTSEELIASAIISVVATRLHRDEASSLAGLREELTGLALAPYPCCAAAG